MGVWTPFLAIVAALINLLAIALYPTSSPPI
jgi:hypothetical protein